MQMVQMNNQVSRHNNHYSMFHIIHKQPLCLPTQPAPLLFLIPLPHGRIATITKDNVITIYRLDPPALLSQISLQNQPRRVVPVGNNSLAVLMPLQQSLVEVHFGKKWSEPALIHRFQSTTHHLMPRNPIKQKEYLSTMQLYSFLHSDCLFLKQQSPQNKKTLLRYFYKSGQQWQQRSKDLGISYSKVDKMDEQCSVAVFNPPIEATGSFRFRKINLGTMDEEIVMLDSQSFTDFAVVVAVKQHKSDILVQVNKKNPEIICFRQHQEHHSRNTGTSALWVVNLGSILVSLCFSLEQTADSELQIRNGTELMDTFPSKFMETSISKDGLVIQYEREMEEGQHRRVNTYRPISKDKLYLHLMRSAFKMGGQHKGLLNDVLSLLAN